MRYGTANRPPCAHPALPTKGTRCHSATPLPLLNAQMGLGLGLRLPGIEKDMRTDRSRCNSWNSLYPYLYLYLYLYF